MRVAKTVHDLRWLGLLVAAGCAAEPPPPAIVMTVGGPIVPARMGIVLPHEHVLVDFAPAEAASSQRYDRDSVVAITLPYVTQAHALGVRTLFDATPAYLGRDVGILQELSQRSGMHIVTNTGYYGARDDQHLPSHAFAVTADALAARWIREWRNGIDGTDVRPGFIKIGVDPGPLSDVDRTLIQAAARTHLATGLTIAAHTGTATGAFEQMAVLDEEGVDPGAWIWVHAQAEPDSTQHVRAARRGAWISFDGLAPDNIEGYVALVSFMKSEGLLDRVLVSHDAGWYHVGEPGGGDFRPYDTFVTAFLPALEAAGFSAEEIHRLTTENPARAFTVRVKTKQRSRR
jgi:phosphotriesterase-related protein